MARRFLVQTEYDAIDGMTPTMKRINTGMGRFAANITDKNSMIGRSFGSMNRMINRGISVALLSLTVATGAAAAEYVKFDQTITGANVRFKDFVLGSEESAKMLDALKIAAREVGATTQFTATQAAEGLNFYAKAGFTSAEAMAVLKDTVDLATVAEMDFNRTADISSDLLGAFGLNVQDSAKKIENLKTVNRALGIATNIANVNLEDLFESLKVAAPIASAAGEGMHELVAMTASLGSAGIKGSMAATALKNAYTRLVDPTKEISDALHTVGLSTKDFIDQSGDMKSMITIMGMIGKATSGLGKAEQLKVFSAVFGARAVAGAVNLSKSLADIEFIMAKLESETKLADLADEIRKGLGMQIEILKSSLIELGFKFITAFEKDGRSAIKQLTEMVQNFDVKPLVNFANILIDVIKFIAGNWKTLLSLAIAIKGVSAALAVVNIAVGVFGVTLSATPIGLIIAGVAALSFAIAELILHFDQVKEAARKAWEWVSKPFNVFKKSPEQQMLSDMGYYDKQSADLASSLDTTFGGAQTPTPNTGGASRDFGRVEIDIRNSANATVKQSKNMPNWAHVNMTPSYSH